MRFCVEFKLPKPISLPTSYNHAVQGIIYSSMSGELREFLHEKGFEYCKRRFKLFTFSRLLGPFKKEGSAFIFNGKVRLWISSPVEKVISELANAFLRSSEVNLCGNKLSVASIEIPRRPNLDDRLICRTLSPITVYSTLRKADGSKKTYYYSPFEDEFNELLTKNLVKKASIIAGKEVSGEVRVKPLRKRSCREVICNFKGTIIKAWEGLFRVEGDRVLLEAMYEAGLGCKNSSGFGMVEVVGYA